MIDSVHLVRHAHYSHPGQAPMIEKKVSILLLEILTKSMIAEWLRSRLIKLTMQVSEKRNLSRIMLWLFVNGMGPPNANELWPCIELFFDGLEWSTSSREIEILHFTASRCLTFKFNGSTCQIVVSKGHLDIIDFLPTN